MVAIHSADGTGNYKADLTAGLLTGEYAVMATNLSLNLVSNLVQIFEHFENE